MGGGEDKIMHVLTPATQNSFDVLKIVNTYGAFGSVTKSRTEVVIQGSHDGIAWLDYEFKCKPGDISRMPCLISPWVS